MDEHAPTPFSDFGHGPQPYPAGPASLVSAGGLPYPPSPGPSHFVPAGASPYTQSSGPSHFLPPGASPYPSAGPPPLVPNRGSPFPGTGSDAYSSVPSLSGPTRTPVTSTGTYFAVGAADAASTAGSSSTSGRPLQPPAPLPRKLAEEVRRRNEFATSRTDALTSPGAAEAPPLYSE